MANDMSVSAINQHLAREIRRAAREEPDSPYANKFVGIADGRVVAVAETLREADQRVREVEPDPARCYIVDAGADYEMVQEIWGAQ